MKVIGCAVALTLVLSACTPGTKAAPAAGPGLEFLGQLRIPPGATLDGTVIGGLSGISYDPQSGLYYIISDDRSAKNPARFYTARIRLSDNGIDDVEFVSTQPWLDPAGQPFQPLDEAASPPVIPPDAEDIAVDIRRQQLYWSSEGERLTENPEAPVLLSPWVRAAGLDGSYRGDFILPTIFTMSADETGPRRNEGLEGLALSPSGSSLWAAMEGPGYSDGESPTSEHGALTRLTRFDAATGTATAQYAYPLDPATAGAGGTNGFSDLVALDEDHFLTIERGYGTRASAQVYRVAVGDADDVLRRPSLQEPGVTPMTKTLVADLTSTPGLRPLDNIEGITLGPTLPDGRQSVVLVSDDNFSPTQITQFLAFAM